MRPLILIAGFVLLAAACTGTAPPTVSPIPTTTASPAAASPVGIVWEEYHSDNLGFSLQLPRGWTARRPGPGEGEALRADGGDGGSLLVTIDTAAADRTFEEYIQDTFATLIESNPDAVQTLNLPGGRAARGVLPGEDGVSVIYMFAPRGDHAKLISFTGDGLEPNPLWALIAERFNAYSPRPIIPFRTPAT